MPVRWPIWAGISATDSDEREVRYLMDQEWAMSADDVLWRRSKLGLHVARDTAAALESWFAATAPGAVRSAQAGVA